MVFFGKDLGAFEGESKYDMLAVSVARHMGENVKFSVPGICPELGVTQFGDGLVRRAEGKKNVYVFHDWYDAYKKHLGKYDKAIFLGKFDHPSFENSVELASYPVEPLIERPEATDFPVLICGEYEERCHDWLVGKVEELLSEKYMRIRLACPYVPSDNDEYGYWRMRHKLASMMVTEKDLCQSPFASIKLLGEYMSSVKYILHCGGHRGMVHSMAVSTNKCCSYTHDDSYRPTAVSELVARLLPLLR